MHSLIGTQIGKCAMQQVVAAGCCMCELCSLSAHVELAENGIIH